MRFFHLRRHIWTGLNHTSGYDRSVLGVNICNTHKSVAKLVPMIWTTGGCCGSEWVDSWRRI